MAPVDPFAKRKKCLRTMAQELSVLCGVDVALVVSPADGDAGGAVAWESREGVMARYRALPPKARARHTHLAYLEDKLGKEVAKLARVRRAGPVALRDDAALGLLDGNGAGTAAEDARRLLDAIDAAIRAADARRRALGMPADGGDAVVLEGVGPVSSAPGVVVDGGDYCYLGGAGGGHDAMWGNEGGAFQFQPFTCSAAGDVQPGGYGFQFQEQCATTTSGGGGVGMDGYYYNNLQMEPSAMYGDSSSSSSHVVADAYPYYQVPRHAPQPNPMWSAADAPRHAMAPAEYTCVGTGLRYYNYMVDTPAARSASLQGNGGGMPFATGATSGNFGYDSPPELSLATGNDIAAGGGGGNFISATPTDPLADSTGGAGDNFAYGTPAQTFGGELTDAGWYAAEWQQPWRDCGGQEPIEQLHYLRDMEDTQLHLWGN